MGLDNLIFVFTMIAGGLFLSLIILSFEIYKKISLPGGEVLSYAKNQTDMMSHAKSSGEKWKRFVVQRKLSSKNLGNLTLKWRNRTENRSQRSQLMLERYKCFNEKYEPHTG